MNKEIPEDLRDASMEADATIGDELSALLPPFERPISPKVMTALAGAVASVAKVMGVDVVPEKYTEPTTELDPDLVRLMAMIEAAAADWGSPLPMTLPEIENEAGITTLTAALTELAKDEGFIEFLDMGEETETEDMEEEAEGLEEENRQMEFDFASRMAPRG